MEVSSQFHAPVALTPGKNRGTHLTAGWVSPRAGLGYAGSEARKVWNNFGWRPRYSLRLHYKYSRSAHEVQYVRAHM